MTIQLQMAGFYKIEAFKTDTRGKELEGSRRIAADWFPNLILNAGLERIGIMGDYMQYCRVGAGSTPPNVNDTALDSQIASSSTSAGSVSGAQSTAPYFGWRRRTYRFGEGVAAGNISEVGVGWGTGTNLFSRALVLDPGGTPTTISVGTDESLDVTYELRTYAPTEDVTGTVNMAGVDHAWQSRAASVTSAARWAVLDNGAVIGPNSSTAFTGAIGAITETPSGTSANLTTTRGTYSPGSMKIGITISANLSQGNIPGGIRSVFANSISGVVGSYQFEFDPPIPKDATKVFSLTVEVSWARKT